jgi:hypothetical protein
MPVNVHVGSRDYMAKQIFMKQSFGLSLMCLLSAECFVFKKYEAERNFLKSLCKIGHEEAVTDDDNSIIQ